MLANSVHSDERRALSHVSGIAAAEISAGGESMAIDLEQVSSPKTSDLPPIDLANESRQGSRIIPMDLASSFKKQVSFPQFPRL
jgi:hypothetical protein